MAKVRQNVTLKLKQFKKEFQPIILNIYSEFAKKVVETAKQNAPVRTGALRDSITWSVVANNKEIVGVRIRVGVDYGFFVEFGTTKQSPQPYLFPAIETNKKLLNDLIKKELDKIL